MTMVEVGKALSIYSLPQPAMLPTTQGGGATLTAPLTAPPTQGQSRGVDLLAKAREIAEARGRSLKPETLDVDLETDPLALIGQYLAPYRAALGGTPHTVSRLGLTSLAPLFGIRPTSVSYMYKWFDGSVAIPLRNLLLLLNTLQVEDPAWLTFLLYRKPLHLDCYFKPVIFPGNRIALVTRKSQAASEITCYEDLATNGLGPLIHQERIKRGMLHLQDLVARMADSPLAKQRGLKVNRAVVSDNETNRKRTPAFLDLFIEALDLCPSEAFIAAGYPWLPRLVPVIAHPIWEANGESAVPMTETWTHPYPEDYPVTYSVAKRVRSFRGASDSPFGKLIKQARVLTHMGLEEAANHLSIGRDRLVAAERGESELPSKVLERMLTLYEGALHTLLGKEADLSNFFVRQSIYPDDAEAIELIRKLLEAKVSFDQGPEWEAFRQAYGLDPQKRPTQHPQEARLRIKHTRQLTVPQGSWRYLQAGESWYLYEMEFRYEETLEQIAGRVLELARTQPLCRTRLIIKGLKLAGFRLGQFIDMLESQSAKIPNSLEGVILVTSAGEMVGGKRKGKKIVFTNYATTPNNELLFEKQDVERFLTTTSAQSKPASWLHDALRSQLPPPS